MVQNVCVILFTVLVTVNSQFRFDYKFVPKVGGFLKLHIMPATFHDAFRKCDAEGAMLASPLYTHLKNAMLSLHRKTTTAECGLFTGIHSIFTKGSYASVDGKMLSEIPMQWAQNEPNNFNNGEDCIVMLQDGTLADVRCNETFPYVCYKKKTANMNLNECGTTDNEYSLDHRTGSCYKFHYIGRTWRHAHMTCMAEGGYLAIINSNTEVQVIKDLFGLFSHEKIFAASKDVASIGFHDWGETGVWYTVHGERLQDSGFSSFSDGQPDNDRTFDPSGSSCGAVFRTGQLDDMWCTGHNLPFICEKEPNSLNSK